MTITRLEYQPSPSQCSATGAPVDLEFLCPSPVSSGPPFCFPPETDQQSNFTKQSTPFRLCSELPCLSKSRSVPQRRCLSVSLNPAEHLPTALQSSAQGRRHSVWEGRGSSMGVLPPASVSPSLFLFLVCLSHLCYCSEPRSFLPLSCTAPLTLICQSCPAILCHLRKKGRNASGWQVSRQLCHGGPPGIVEPPFGSYYSRFFSSPFFYFLLLLPKQ